MKKWKWSCSVVSNSLQTHGMSPARLLHPWDFPGKNTGVGCHFILQEIVPTQGLNSGLPHCSQMLYHLNHQWSPLIYICTPVYIQNQNVLCVPWCGKIWETYLNPSPLLRCFLSPFHTLLKVLWNVILMMESKGSFQTSPFTNFSLSATWMFLTFAPPVVAVTL